MKFFESSLTVVPRGKTVKFSGQHTELYNPNATLIVAGELNLGEDEHSSSHVYVKNMVILPGGKITFTNTQVIITENLINHGSLKAKNGLLKSTTFITKGMEENRNWGKLRVQLFWTRENDPDCSTHINVKESVARVEGKLSEAL